MVRPRAPPAGGGDLLQQATERLEAYKSHARTQAVKQLTEEHGLSDEVQLALRLLAPEHLEELLAGGADLQQKLSEVEDRNVLMRSLVSMLDPDVEALVAGLQEMEAGEQQAPEQAADQAGGDDLLAEAQRRLAANKSATSAAAIKKFTRVHGLGDEVQLALRMLDPAGLEEILAGEADIKQKLAQVADRDELVLSLVSMLDPDVVQLVRGLQTLDQDKSGEAEAGGAGKAAAGQSDKTLLAAAEARLAANKTATSVSAIETFVQENGLGEGVQLAMRMLQPSHLEELLAGEEALQQKFAQVTDRDQVMMSLIKMMDSEVESLVTGLQKMEQGGGGGGQGEAALSGEDLVAEAQRRLQEHKTPFSSAVIKKMSQDHGLSDEAQLALRLLAPGQLKEFMAGGRALTQKLQQAADSSSVVLQLVEMMDPSVGSLVQGLTQMDSPGAAAPPRAAAPAAAATRVEVAPTRPKAPPPPAAPRPKSAPAPGPAAAAGGWEDRGGDWGQDAKRRKGEDGGWKGGWKEGGWKGGGESWGGGGGGWKDWGGKADSGWGGDWKAEKWPASEAPKADSWGAKGGKAQGKGAPAGKPAQPEGKAVKGKGGTPPARVAIAASPPPAAEPAPAAAAGGGVAKKKPKCMICKGDHRAADCPKMK